MKKKIKDFTAKEANDLCSKLCFSRCLKKKSPCKTCPYFEKGCLAVFIGIAEFTPDTEFEKNLWETEIDTNELILTDNQKKRLARLINNFRR